MRFLSDDGKMFDTKEKCLEYEEAVAERNFAFIKLEIKKDKKYDRIVELHKSLIKEIEAYESDYNTHIFHGLYKNGLLQLLTVLK